jgi:hypothetical protein
LMFAAVAHGEFAAGFFYEDAAHRLGSGPEEVSPATEVRIRTAHQPQPGLMHERGGLQRLVGRLIRHACHRQLAQFLIDQRKQFIGGLGITVLNGLKNLSKFAQLAKVIKISGLVPVNLASAQLKNHGPVALFHRTMG